MLAKIVQEANPSQEAGLELSELSEPNAVVVGIGGAGSKFVNYLTLRGSGHRTVAINTDQASLESIKADSKLLVGPNVARGQGAGGHPEIGLAAAEGAVDAILESIAGHKLVFVVGAMGGGTGTSVTPMVAQLAKDNGAMVMPIAMMPFSAEVTRQEVAQAGLANLRQVSPKNILVLSNDNLLKSCPGASIFSAFETMNNLIGQFIDTTHAEIVTALKAVSTKVVEAPAPAPEPATPARLEVEIEILDALDEGMVPESEIIAPAPIHAEMDMFDPMLPSA